MTTRPHRAGLECEKVFSCRFAPRYECLQQAIGNAGADAPEVAKCPDHTACHGAPRVFRSVRTVARLCICLPIADII